MTTRSAADPRRLFDLLASIRVGVVAMAVLAVVCGVATFYESSHGTAAAQRVFYQTRWFTLLLALLATNILFSTLKRYPWTRHQAGFVMAHVGILLLLVGSLVSLHLGLDGSVALFEGQGTGNVSLRERALEVEVAGRHQSFPADFESQAPRPDRPARFALAGTTVTLVAEDYAPHVAVTETIEPGAGGVPALAFALDGAFGHEEGWLLARDGRDRADMGPLALLLRTAATEAAAREALAAPATGNQVAFVMGPAARLRYAVRAGEGAATTGEVVPSRAVSTPWMGLTVRVSQAVPSAVLRRAVAPARPPADEERRTPAVRVRFDSPAGGTASEWVPWGESLGADLQEGPASIAFGERQVALPFRITLLDFRSEKYPGSRMAATYESRVRLDEAGVSSEHLISMNHPLHHRGYVFFQASFVEGQPMMSILSVSRSPGLPMVYLGTALLSLGVAWMFYVKPLIVRRQARQAARRRAAATTARVAEATS